MKRLENLVNYKFYLCIVIQKKRPFRHLLSPIMKCSNLLINLLSFYKSIHIISKWLVNDIKVHEKVRLYSLSTYLYRFLEYYVRIRVLESFKISFLSLSEGVWLDPSTSSPWIGVLSFHYVLKDLHLVTDLQGFIEVQQ